MHVRLFVGRIVIRLGLYLDESYTSGYPAGAAMNVLRVVFAQRILRAKRVRHDLR